MYDVNFFDEKQAITAFADRVPQSVAMAAALEFHANRSSGNLTAIPNRRNVLMFFGIGGIGKTTLSDRLEAWIKDELEDPGEWGEPPDIDRIVTGRWELNNSHGNLSAARLLIDLRDTMGKSQRNWPAFDVAFSSYFSSIRPGEPLPELAGNTAPVESGVVTLAQNVVQDLKDFSSDLELDYSNLVSEAGGGLLRSAIKVLRVAARRHQAFKHAPQLDRLLDRCSREPSPENQMPHLVPHIMSMLTLDMNALPVSKRPVPVIFIDHFEKVQTPGRRLGEELLNACIHALPGVLFVITGRNRMDWDSDSRLSLPKAGAAAWPGLVKGAAEDPRQHLVGSLSEEDTRSVVTQRAEIEGIALAPAVVEAIVTATRGWPIHIDAVATYIRNVAADGRRVRVDDVRGDLTTIMELLVEDLPDDETKALQAACLLPFFDTALAAAVGNVDEGAVIRFTGRAIIIKTSARMYPFRVHDAVRDAVKSAGPHASGGWSERDWASAARRGLAEAHSRYDAGKALHDDAAMIRALGLALRICQDYSLWDEWLTEAVPHTPSFAGMEDVMPSRGTQGLTREVEDTLEYVAAHEMGSTEESLEVFKRLESGGGCMARSASLWIAYRLRSLGRFAEASEQIAALMDTQPDRKDLLRRQSAITLAMGRRFQDGMAAADQLNPEPRGSTRDYIRQFHGDFSGFMESTSQRLADVTAKRTRRYHLELESRLVRARALCGTGNESETRQFYDYVTAVGFRVGRKHALTALGYFCITDRSKIASIAEELQSVQTVAGPLEAQEAELLALHALALNDTALGEEVASRFSENPRPSPLWIRAEILLEELGIRVATVETQWTEPYDVVRARWLKLYRELIARQP